MDTNSIHSFEKLGFHGLRKSISTNPSHSSAEVLNNLIKAYNISKTSYFKSINLKNFAIGSEINSENLRLSYGLKNISPNSPKYVENILILGKGIVQKNNFFNAPSINDDLFAFNLSDIYNDSESLSNCYILGAIYFTYDNNLPAIEFVIGKPQNENNNLILHKDCSLQDIEKILKFENSISYDSSTDNSFLLYKFILDIDQYQNSRRLDRYFLHLYDLRMPEGLFGLADEELFSNMINNLINGNNRIENALNAELILIMGIVRAWINLNSWEPSFKEYWSISEKAMPSELKSFINIYLGISV